MNTSSNNFMKAKINVIAFVGCMLLAMASCNNQECQMTTVVNSDGSCSRDIALHLDSTQLVTGKISQDKNCVDIGKNRKLSWSMQGQEKRHPWPMSRETYDSIAKIAADSGKTVRSMVTVHALSTWNSVADMSSHTIIKLEQSRIKPQAQLSSKFRWFYTDYTYRETYPQQKIPFKVPLSRFMSQEEMGFWFTGSPNLAQGLNGSEIDDLTGTIKSNLSKWMCANWFEALYAHIVKNYSAIASPPVAKQQFVALHDSLSKQFIHELNEPSNTFDLKDSEQFFANFFHSQAYTPLLKQESTIMHANPWIGQYLELTWFNIDYRVVMPGSITSCEGGIVKDEVAIFRLTGERLITANHCITIGSRATHTWAFIVTALVAIAALASVVYRKRK